MIAMRDDPRLGFEPGAMRRIRRADQRQRPAEGVDDLLVMPVLPEQTFRAPGPARWQLPLTEMFRETVRVGVRLCDRRSQRPGDAVGLHIFDSDRISSAACANS